MIVIMIFHGLRLPSCAFLIANEHGWYIPSLGWVTTHYNITVFASVSKAQHGLMGQWWMNHTYDHFWVVSGPSTKFSREIGHTSDIVIRAWRPACLAKSSYWSHVKQLQIRWRSDVVEVTMKYDVIPTWSQYNSRCLASGPGTSLFQWYVIGEK